MRAMVFINKNTTGSAEANPLNMQLILLFGHTAAEPLPVDPSEARP